MSNKTWVGGEYDPTPRLWNRAKMTKSERAVAAALLSFVNHMTGVCFPSQKAIADRAGMSERTVRTALKSLEIRHFITRRRRGLPTGSASDEFTLHPDAIVSGTSILFAGGSISWEDESSETVQAIRSSIEPKRQILPPRVRRGRPKIEPKRQFRTAETAMVADGTRVPGRESLRTPEDQLNDGRLRGLGLTDAQVIEVMRHTEAERTAALEYASTPGKHSLAGSFLYALRNQTKIKRKKVDSSRPNAPAYRESANEVIGLHTGPTTIGTLLAAKIAAKLGGDTRSTSKNRNGRIRLGDHPALVELQERFAARQAKAE